MTSLLTYPAPFVDIALIAWIAMAVVMALLWRVQLRTSDAGIVDVAWAFGTGAIALALIAAVSQGDDLRRGIVIVMALVWSLRLGVFLWRRIRAGGVEEGRYRYLREVLGERAAIGFFLFFQLQALWALMFALPMWAASEAARPLDVWDGLGIAVWLVGLVGESIADAQLARFRSDPSKKGRVCDSGLWGRCRHPNYFFEWLQWWGFALLGLGSPWWWITIIGIGLMYVFINHITGIPYTERQALRSRGDAYRRYQAQAPAFFPRILQRRKP
ncbi:MAG: DUF1295 domain-containing protein [Ectothiorhodospiraceae bacterium AqS1]|nr:DUF1295 domain-containing protein [Ectothiorhodospiraceae bacterium AqS1]